MLHWPYLCLPDQDTNVRKIRVLVANRPLLMRDLVLTAIANQPDVDLVGTAQQESEVQDLVHRTRPDVLILALDRAGAAPELCGFLLGCYPQMKVLGVDPERNVSVLYWAAMDIRSKSVEMSAQGLLGVLRESAQAEPDMAPG
jgi:DNA-binding NarL/FixJ family response regulator